MNHSFRSTAKAFTQTGDSTPDYMLKLSSDLSLRTVPGLLGFPSDPCAISDASAAHTLSSRHALRIRPVTAHCAVSCITGFACITARPVSTSPNTKSVDWVERTLSCSSALRSRTNQSYPVCSFSDLQRLGESLRPLAGKWFMQLAVCLLDPLTQAHRAGHQCTRRRRFRHRHCLLPTSYRQQTRNIIRCVFDPPNHTHT